MNLLKPLKTVVWLPIWIAQLGTSAKSFLDNPLLGSQRLNRAGLHRERVRLAAAMTRWRRRRLAHRVPAAWREAFDRDGYVAIPEIVPPGEFPALREALLAYEGPAREMRQGDAITRRLAVDPAMLAALPQLRRLLARPDVRALFHYVAGFRIEPLHYIQTIVTHDGANEADPQEALHADAFHSSLKAWLFLNPVSADEAPFRFVPGSHRMEGARLDWEYRRSLADPRAIDRLSARGSPRVGAGDLDAMALPPALDLAVSANTLVVADTVGFHARGASVRPVERVEIWSYSRRNPFVPWLGADPLSLPGLAERRVGWLWSARDRLERWVGQPWRKVGRRTAAGPDA
ncbi:phytanoyl-CoA dioxygenase family protein [Novosphingobium soli]|uniref:Phytanoyl-CoA dioxygenase family protein n=1 Tax=Novosphingobium soli TaxID=574956 RepID=A0ABV6CST8_9SPHN